MGERGKVLRGERERLEPEYCLPTVFGTGSLCFRPSAYKLTYKRSNINHKGQQTPTTMNVLATNLWTIGVAFWSTRGQRRTECLASDCKYKTSCTYQPSRSK